MAEENARSSQQPPHSQPPSTDDVDSGWPEEERPLESRAESQRPGSMPPARLQRASLASLDSFPPPSAPARGSQRARRGAPIWAVVAMLLVAVGGVWLALDRGSSVPSSEASAVREVAAVTPAPTVEPARPAAESPKREEPAAPAVAESAAPSATDAPAIASAATSESPAPAASGSIQVTVRLNPPDARLYRKGKEVGTSGVVLTLDPGERRAFEVTKPGYITRKLIVDGTKSEVQIGLRPDPAATP